MTILDMIAEWRKDHSGDCVECTEGLICYIEEREREAESKRTQRQTDDVIALLDCLRTIDVRIRSGDMIGALEESARGRFLVGQNPVDIIESITRANAKMEAERNAGHRPATDNGSHDAKKSQVG